MRTTTGSAAGLPRRLPYPASLALPWGGRFSGIRSWNCRRRKSVAKELWPKSQNVTGALWRFSSRGRASPRDRGKSYHMSIAHPADVRLAPIAQPADTTGRSHPLGATPVPGGVNFSIYSRDASKVELLFFDREDDGRPRESFLSIPPQTAPTTIGTCSCPGAGRARSTAFGFTDLSSQSVVFALIRPSSSLILTAAA